MKAKYTAIIQNKNEQ